MYNGRRIEMEYLARQGGYDIEDWEDEERFNAKLERAEKGARQNR